MRDMLMRILVNVTDRVGGPMTFRIILQPIMAALLAIRAGVKDARAGRPAYFWTILTDPNQRADLVREGWKSVARVFFLAMIMDVIYQVIVLQWVYPFEVILVAILLAVVPYLLIRGPVNRLAKRLLRKREATN
ncbi:MAG TPA: hypothetical protein VLB68_13760 [Pyrinomonadaceae bacterium]|nr:hypothetical protein [Pyrinomonadaceae bacterium]